MDKLWAPWRVNYITKIGRKPQGSLFTRLLRDKKNDKKNYVFFRREHCFSVLNLYPYNNGHSLIVPNRKVKDLCELKKDERDKKHEAIADRNALWVLLGVLIVGILYQSITSALQNIPLEVDYFLVAALLAAVLIRAFTNYYLDLSH